MGFGAPLHDVKGHSTSRPPLVMFVMCLLLFACATLAMAFYVQYADVVLNPEIRVSWKKFISRLDALDLCTYADDRATDDDVAALSQFIDGGTYNATAPNESVVSITVAASLFLVREYKKFPAGMMAVTGKIQINGSLSDSTTTPSHLNMTFVIPRNLTETRFKDTCVILTGPSWLLPLSRRSNVCIPSSVNRTITHVGVLYPMQHNDTTACRNGSSIRLSYNSQSDDDFYLSKEERWSIYSRLIHSSYFLFVLAVTFICYFFIRGRIRGSSGASIDKIPLTL